MKLIPGQIANPHEGHPATTALLGYLPGVYFLLDYYEEVLYIGQSRCIASRIRDHFKKGVIPFVKVAWIEISVDLLLESESALIQDYQPPFNSVEYRKQYSLEVAKGEF